MHTNPRGKYYGVCDPAKTDIYDPTFICNEKLIGAWDFADSFEPPDGPRDNDGHGSHTASTAAGNRVNASVIAPTYVYNNLVSGVAPRANIIAYDACGQEGCPGSALVAAINQAVADGVDVINYSIGGGSRNPWRSADALAFLAALDAGVYVSVSAGNAGPSGSTIGSPSNAPWVTSVAAATHHRRFANRLVGMSGGNTTPPADIAGQGVAGGYGPARIVYAGNYTSTLGASDALCRQPFSPGTFNGEIVVCDRGVVGRVAKSQNVAVGGAGGFVLANDALNGDSLNADAYVLPGVHIPYNDGVVLKAWLAAGGVTNATIAGAQPQVDPAFGDIMAAFSSRGPDATSPSVLKPDITAPGVDIMAAIHTGGNYGVLSGTSMAQNWLGSGADEDFFAMKATQVSRNNQSAAFTVSGPNSAAIGTPFDLQLAWNFPTLAAGDTRLALLEVGTDAGAPNNILSLPVTLRRLDDDVTVRIDDPQVLANDYAQPGDVIPYTIRIAPEPTAPSPVNYVVTVTLPTGLTYAPGSAVLASSTMQATIDPIVNGDQFIWNVADVVNAPRYVMSTNDPERDDYSPACGTPFGNQFLHLGDFDIPLRPAVDGNGKTWNVDAFFDGAEPYTFFGDNYPSLSFTDDGLLSVLGFDPALNSGVNAPIPTSAAPNALLAPGWADFKIVYDEEAGTGVRIAGAGGGALMFIEYNGLQNNEGAAGALDMQAAVWRVVTPDYPEIVFSYDRIAGALPTMVIGLESVDGTEGVAYTDGIRDNLLICFDWTADEIDLTYRVQVNQDAALDQEQETIYQSALSAPGYGIGETIDALFVTGVALDMSVSGPERVLPGSPITYTLTVTNNGVGEAANLQVMAEMPWGARHLHGGSVNGRIVSFEIPSLAGGASTQLQYSVEHDDAQLVAAASPARQLSPTIVGGEPAEPGEFPWQAALLDANNGLWWGCGGSLISPTWVATAAHCVTSGLFVSPPQTLNVAVGRHHINSNEGQRIAVAEVIVHPAWNPWTYDADIALLRLTQPAILTDTVQIIPLAMAADADLTAEGRLATATGWGTRSEGQQDYPDVLYKVTVPFVAQSACEFAYATTSNAITGNMLCAGLLQGGKDACQGDSGGPLVVSDGIDSYKLAGIVSWGEGCARPGLPGVYTRVANFVDWIGIQRDTLRSGRYMVSDASGLPGHSFVGDDSITTVVRAIEVMLPLITR